MGVSFRPDFTLLPLIVPVSLGLADTTITLHEHLGTLAGHDGPRRDDS